MLKRNLIRQVFDRSAVQHLRMAVHEGLPMAAAELDWVITCEIHEEKKGGIMGMTTAQDRVDVAVFLKNAADAGDPRSNHFMGMRALRAGQHEVAFPRFRAAAHLGYGPSQSEAAYYLLHHPSIDGCDWSKIPYNEIEAINLVQKLDTTLGARMIMGYVHEHGLGGFQTNLTKARELYQWVYNYRRKYFGHQASSRLFQEYRISPDHLDFAQQNYKP
jgi:hypothetical protein